MTEEIDRDNEQFNQGVNHVVDLLAKTIGQPDGWIAGDGSEDYDNDLAQTLLNILTAKGLYDPETGDYTAGWRPIETAPKDGTWVMGFENPEGMNTKYCPQVIMRWRESSHRIGWFNDGGHGYQAVVEPLFWQPLLPSPPDRP